MTNRNSGGDRREFPRFRSKGCMFAAQAKFGRVVDLSLGGAAIYYADREAWSTTAFAKGTFHFGDSCTIEDLPMQTVADHEFLTYYAPGSMTVRRRSIRFDKLTPEQKRQLAHFIAIAASGRKDRIRATLSRGNPDFATLLLSSQP